VATKAQSPSPYAPCFQIRFAFPYIKALVLQQYPLEDHQVAAMGASTSLAQLASLLGGRFVYVWGPRGRQRCARSAAALHRCLSVEALVRVSRNFPT
jgi:hypothetical protein